MDGLVLLDSKNYKKANIITSSLIIAREFGKEHFHIIRDIKKLIELGLGEYDGYFIESQYKAENGKINPMYMLTKDGLIMFILNTTKSIKSCISLTKLFSSVINEDDNIEAIYIEDKPKKKIYIIQDKNTKNIKIGVSKDPQSRLCVANTYNPNTLCLIYESKPIKNAMQLEHRIHMYFMNYNIKNEWFKISSNVAIDYIKSIIKIFKNKNIDMVETVLPKIYFNYNEGFSNYCKNYVELVSNNNVIKLNSIKHIQFADEDSFYCDFEDDNISIFSGVYDEVNIYFNYHTDPLVYKGDVDINVEYNFLGIGSYNLKY